MVDAIIFDFDGVLVESMDIKARAFAHLFKEYPDQVNRIVDYHNIHGGLSRFEKFRTIYKDFLGKPLPNDKERDLGEKFAEFVFQAVVECPFVKGASEFLEKYYRRVPLYVVSGTPQDEIRQIVARRNLGKYFVEVLGSPRKKTELNRLIVCENAYDPASVVFVGDSVDDWEGANAVGLRFIARVIDDKVFKGLPLKETISDLCDLNNIMEKETWGNT